MDLICRDALAKKMFYVEEKNGGHGWVVALEDISKAPTVEGAKEAHGEWRFDSCNATYFCSNCWEEILECKGEDGCNDFCFTNYCPNCGAKMDGDGNG